MEIFILCLLFLTAVILLFFIKKYSPSKSNFLLSVCTIALTFIVTFSGVFLGMYMNSRNDAKRERMELSRRLEANAGELEPKIRLLKETIPLLDKMSEEYPAATYEEVMRLYYMANQFPYVYHVANDLNEYEVKGRLLKQGYSNVHNICAEVRQVMLQIERSLDPSLLKTEGLDIMYKTVRIRGYLEYYGYCLLLLQRTAEVESALHGRSITKKKYIEMMDEVNELYLIRSDKFREETVNKSGLIFTPSGGATL